MGPERRENLIQDGLVLLHHALGLAELQHSHGRKFILEDPVTAISRGNARMKKLANSPGTTS
eukprot:2112297-Pyramimonas_sp.AAC.1